ncbi:glycosyltransferase [Bacillus daqingensis]|uniref:Glycosyltransferase n=1 Tax=Bacillus daqingensis TaxID=872396 RepID=A0ABV9NSY2_9BACI
MKILLTCGDFKIGGVQKSLMEVIKLINENFNSEITILVNNNTGEWKTYVPENVIIHELPNHIKGPQFTRKSFYNDIKNLSSIREVINFIKISFVGFKNYKKKRLLYWEAIKYNNRSIIDEEYDLAISYNGGIDIWNQLVVDSIISKKKICWIHGRIENLLLNKQYENKYLNKFDEIVVVSENLKKNVYKHFDSLPKVKVIPNIINEQDIITKSRKSNIAVNYNITNFVSIGRIDTNKNYSLGVQSLKILANKGYKFIWYIVGEGNRKEELMELIHKENMEQYIVLTGNLENPYFLIREADVLLHFALSEGYGLVLAESIILNTIVLSVNYEGVNEVITNDNQGIIVSYNPNNIALNIEDIIKKPKSNLKDERINTFLSNKEAYHQIISLINKAIHS